MTTPDLPQTGIDYERLVEESLRSVVRKSLSIAAQTGLPGDSHFYISFATTYPGVALDDSLLADHPVSMTIVLQHQFADLTVEDTFFEVTLFFGGKPSPMHIPYDAVTSFNDPSVGFGLQFGAGEQADNDAEGSVAAASDDGAGDKGALTVAKTDSNDDSASADVVSLDTFRKKPTK